MTITIQKVKPAEIEAESFRIIEQELGAHEFSDQNFPVLRRVIHATGDFSFAQTIKFNGDAVNAGIAALRSGKDILVDVNMAAAGISKNILAKWGGKIICGVADSLVAEKAKSAGQTRSEAAMEHYLQDNIGIVAIGNAPTALLKILSLIKDRPALCPDLIVGVPVGFVNAAESKDLLAQTSYPFITNLGRKGGSPVAAAIVNAILRLAQEE